MNCEVRIGKKLSGMTREVHTLKIEQETMKCELEI